MQATTTSNAIISTSATNSSALTSISDAAPPLATTKSGLSDCPEPFTKWFCLNGGTCFSVRIQESILYNCWCPIGFNGLRCDFKYTKSQDQPAPNQLINQTTSGLQTPEAAKDDGRWSVIGSSVEGWSALKHELQPSRIQLQQPLPKHTQGGREYISTHHSDDIYLLTIYIFAVLLSITLLFVIIHWFCKGNDMLSFLGGCSPAARRTSLAQKQCQADSIRADQCDKRAVGLANMNNNDCDYANRKINHHHHDGGRPQCKQSIAFQLDRMLKRELSRRLANSHQRDLCDSESGTGLGTVEERRQRREEEKVETHQHQYELYHAAQEVPLVYQVFCPRSQLQSSAEPLEVGAAAAAATTVEVQFAAQSTCAQSSSGHQHEQAIGSVDGSTVTNTVATMTRTAGDQQGRRVTPLEPVWFC